MRRSAVTGIAAVAVATTLVLTACGSSGGGAGSSGSGASGGGKSVAYVSPIASQPGQALVNIGLQSASKELGWDVQTYDANLSASMQVSHVQTIIQQQKAAIGLWPLDSGALQGSFAQAKAANIPVVAVNTTATGIDKSVYWQTNTCAADSPYPKSAARIAKLYPGGNVIVMGGPPVPSIQANTKCFTDAATAAGLKIIATADNTDDTSAGGARLSADLITKHPDVNAFWAYNDSSALGISSSIVAAGKKVQSGSASANGVYVEGTNGDDDAVAAVKQGRLTGTWDPNPVATGWAVIKAMNDFVKDQNKDQLTVKADFYDADSVATYVEPKNRAYTLASLPLVDAKS